MGLANRGEVSLNISDTPLVISKWIIEKLVNHINIIKYVINKNTNPMLISFINRELEVLKTTLKIYNKFLQIWKAINRRKKVISSEFLFKELEHLDFFQKIFKTIFIFNKQIKSDNCKIKLYGIIIFANSLIIKYIKQSKSKFLIEHPNYSLPTLS